MEEKLFTASVTMTPDIYKTFYKLYYKERLKVFNVIAEVIGVLLIALGVILYQKQFGAVWCFIVIWIGAVLLVYPRMAYRKPYKKAKEQKQTTRFTFYETFVSEKTNSKSTDYNYANLARVIETGKYIMIFHSMESVSIVEKESVKEGADALADFLRARTVYKKIK